MKNAALLLLIFVIALLLIPQSSFADEKDNRIDVGTGSATVLSDMSHGTLEKNELSGNIDIGSTFSSYGPSFNDEKIIEYDTEGLNSFSISGNIVYRKESFLSFSYARPFQDTSSQNDMFEKNTSQEGGLERFTGGIRLDPFAESLFPNNIILKKLCSLKYKYTKQLFYGEVIALTDFEYVPRDASSDGIYISGTDTILEGDTIAFKTEFIQSEVSIPITTVFFEQTTTRGRNKTKKIVPTDLRLGYFTIDWTTPSYAKLYKIDDLPVIRENKYSFQGACVSFETQDPGAPGFNLDWSLKFSFNGEIDNAHSDDYDWVGYMGADFYIWWNLYFSEDRNSGLLCSLGGNYAMHRAVADDENGERILEDEDKILRLFINFSYRF